MASAKRMSAEAKRLWGEAEAKRLWGEVEAALASGLHVLLWGRPGTGKTYAARRLALGGREVYGLTVTADTSAAELRGHWVPGRDAAADAARRLADAVEDGRGDQWRAVLAAGLAEVARQVGEVAAGWRWHDGPAIRAWREGARFVVDEVGEASGDALTLLQGVCDDRAVAGMVLPSGERVLPAPGFQVVGTTNTEPRRLPPALVDRFLVVEVTAPAPGAVDSLPEALRASAASLGAAVDEDGRVSVRCLARFVALVDGAGCSVPVAARLAFGERWPTVLDGLEVAGTLAAWSGVSDWRAVPGSGVSR